MENPKSTNNYIWTLFNSKLVEERHSMLIFFFLDKYKDKWNFFLDPGIPKSRVKY